MTVDDHMAGLSTSGSETVFNLDGRIISIIRTPTADGGWLATHEDITEPRLNERKLASTAVELRVVNERFAAAISNLPQEFCAFDADQRLVISNCRFRDIYGYRDDLLRPGSSIHTIAADLAHRGVVPDLPLERLLDLAPDQQHRSLAHVSGREIAILRQRTAEGGWVSTHEDVTNYRRAEELLAEKAAELQQINQRFDVAVRNMPLGICLFDAELRVVLFNERLRELYGLPAGLIRPGLARSELAREMAALGWSIHGRPDRPV